MSYASKFLNAKTTTETPAPVTRSSAPTTQSSMFGRRPAAATSTTSKINAETIASNPWAAKAAAANGIKIEEKLNFESDKQFPSLGASVTPVVKRGAWGSSTVTAAALAADWAAKDAEEQAAAAAEKVRQEEEAARIAAERRRDTFIMTRSDLFRNEVYQSSYGEEEEEDGYPSEGFIEERNYQVESEWPEEQQSTW
jgi:hypothetical protein